jgi:hypothetical protein
MLFKLIANCLFEAEDIDDAFVRLARHFTELYEGDPPSVLQSGKIDIMPMAENVSRGSLAATLPPPSAETRLLELIRLVMDLDRSFLSHIDNTDNLEKLRPDGWHWCDIHVRREGKEEKHQADWLKDVWTTRGALKEFLRIDAARQAGVHA